MSRWAKSRRFLALACCAGAVVSSSASACSLAGLQHSVRFAPNSAAMGTENARALAEWFVGWRDGLGISYGHVISQSVKGDGKGSGHLANERLRNIARLLEPLNVRQVSMQSGDVPLDKRPAGLAAGVLDVIELSIQPACAETGTCCFSKVN